MRGGSVRGVEVEAGITNLLRSLHDASAEYPRRRLNPSLFSEVEPGASRRQHAALSEAKATDSREEGPSSGTRERVDARRGERERMADVPRVEDLVCAREADDEERDRVAEEGERERVPERVERVQRVPAYRGEEVDAADDVQVRVALR